MNRYITSAALFLLLATAGAHAQERVPMEPARPRYGVFIGGNWNVHQADFQSLPEAPCCSPGYKGGSGLAPVFGFQYRMSISPDISLGVRGLYNSSSATLTRDEQTTVEVDAEHVPITIVHSLRASFGSIGLEPHLIVPLTPRLELRGGARIEYMTTHTFEQEERLADDVQRGAFNNGQRVRNQQSGEIVGASPLQAALVAGISYQLPLDRAGRLLAEPELMASYGLTSLVDGLDWKAHAVRLGVGLSYAPMPEPDIPLPATDNTPRPVIAATLTPHGIGADGIEAPIARLTIREVVTHETRPMLGYIFFEQAASELPARYARLSAAEALRFDLSDLIGADQIGTYRQMLNIVGQRLRANPKSTIRLVGTTDGVESREVAIERARAVQKYLNSVWGIETSRVTLTSRALPEKPSNPSFAGGREENRRVEIEGDASILAPLFVSDTIRTATPPTIRLRLNTGSHSDIQHWRITAGQNGEEIHSISGEATPPALLDWSMTDSIASRLGGEPLEFSLELSDRNGSRHRTAVSTIPIDQVTLTETHAGGRGTATIDRYSLILFDYDRADLAGENRALVEMIRTRIPADASVRITGFADLLGESAHNRQLAESRARAVADMLALPAERVSVAGGTNPPYDVASPEGRFYSRTVVIEILSGGEK